MFFGKTPSCLDTTQAVFASPASERFPGANSPTIQPWHQDSRLSIANYELRAKLCKISTSVKLARNPRRITTCKLLDLKLFRMNTCRKIAGEGVHIVTLKTEADKALPTAGGRRLVLYLLAKPIDQAPPRAIKARQESAPDVGTGPKPLPSDGVHYR
jgi:hypothetical protein